MRHLVGVVLGVVMAAVVFFVASWGDLKLAAGQASLAALRSTGHSSLWHDRGVVEGFAALAAAGLVAGVLIAVPRVSPLAAGLPGLVLLAWTGLYLSNPGRAVRYIPLKSRAYGAGFESLLFDGVLALAGLALVIPLFVPSRWRRPAVASIPVTPESDTTSFPDSQATQTMGGGSVFNSDWSASETKPQPRIVPKSQAPWGPAEYRPHR